VPVSLSSLIFSLHKKLVAPVQERRRPVAPIIAGILLSGCIVMAGCSVDAAFAPWRGFRRYRYTTYHVQAGDSLDSISSQFGVPVGILEVLSGTARGSRIQPGTHLRIPHRGELYRGPGYNGVQLLWPVLGGVVTSPFGRRAGRNHEGIDIRAATGEPVFAAHDGRIRFAGSRGSYGNVVFLSGPRVSTLYAHFSQPVVHAGQRVKQGDLLGYAGASGRVSAPHCHFEVRIGPGSEPMKAIDPLLFFGGGER
jgi:murein DD-endopeptidase MepM/ murein hydrolase activator NlpD